MDLIIITTPLQCWIALRVIEEMGIEDYHILYLTRNNSAEDVHYFAEISKGARVSNYIYQPIGRPDVIQQLLMLYKTRTVTRSVNVYKCLYLASIDAIIPGYIIERFDNKIITFDDGSANINKGSAYWMDSTITRSAIYKKILGCSTLEKTKVKIKKHFTIYENAENIVEKNRLVFLKNIFGRIDGEKKPNEELVIIVGQPLSEALSELEIKKIKDYILKLKVDYYIKHPREEEKIIEGVPELPKNGRIAEDVILKLSEKYNITLVGWFSSLMLNLNISNVKKIMLLFPQGSNADEFQRLAIKTNCKVRYL